MPEVELFQGFPVREADAALSKRAYDQAYVSELARPEMNSWVAGSTA